MHRITPLGELDLATVPALRAEFEMVFSDGDAEIIVVDLAELEFMDSTAIRALMDMTAVCEHADRLRIVNGSSFVVKLFDIAGVREHLPIITSADDALAPLSGRTTDTGVRAGSPE
jgi:anti-anti-sigma factor